jgi:hypothetical protein
LSLSMIFDGELQESCARNLRVALSDRETSLDGNNGSWDLVAIPYTRKLRGTRFADRGSFSARPIT